MASTRDSRRVAHRQRVRRERLLAASLVVILLVVLVAVLSSGGSSSQPPPPAARVKPMVDGGPLSPAAVGGLAALWAPQNVVGTQPGTAAAYQAASTVPGPGGYLLIADRGNNRILVVDPQGKTVFLYPSPADLQAGRKLFYNDDTFVEPGGQALIANEEDNHAIVEVKLADHSLNVLFGHPRELGSDETHLNTPDDAYTLPDGSFTVADAYNCRILFIKGGQILHQYGQSGICRHDPPRYLGAVNGATPVPGGGVMISEIPGNWIDEIGPEGKLVFAVRAPVSYPSDPQPLAGGRVLLADYASPGHVLIIDHAGKVLWRYGPSRGYGRMDHPSLALPLPNGNIAVNDDFRNRVLVIDPRTNTIVWKYGHTDSAGSAPGYLNTPDGMDFIPAGPRGGPDYAAVVHP
jgi:hypothetical protein